MKKNRYLQLSILVLIAAAFLRFRNLAGLYVFEGDAEHHVLLAMTLVRDFHIIWIGVNVAHLGMFHGPFWSYFTALWLYITQGDPLILGYISAAIGVVTTLFVIITGWKLFSPKVGVLAGLLYGVLPLYVFHDQKYWNPTATPLLSLLILLSLYQARKNPIWWLVFAAAYSLIFHTHFSLFPLGLIAAYFFVKQLKRIGPRMVAATILVFLLGISPLIVFDYYHKGSNITTPLRFKQISSAETNRINPIHHAQSMFQTLGRFWYLAPNRPSSDEVLVSCSSASIYGTPKSVDDYSTRTFVPVVSFVSLGLFLFFFLSKKTWKKLNTRLLAVQILTIACLFLLFPGGAYEYYLIGIFPLIVFIPPLLLYRYKNYAITRNLLFAIAAIAVLGVYTVLTATGEYGYNTKKRMVLKVMEIVKDQPFEIQQDTSVCHQYEGWRHLFVTYGQKPARSFSDKSLGWYYPEEISKDPTKYTVILADVRIPPEFNTENAQTISEGGFRAYIFKHF